jgi:hypothetical protein
MKDIFIRKPTNERIKREVENKIVLKYNSILFNYVINRKTIENK